MRIYICGGSSEMDRIAGYMRQMRELGHEITHDWVSVIRNAGEANPREAPHEARVYWSGEDLSGIRKANLVWVVLPAKPSFGCAFEAGYAIGHGQIVIVSGDWRASIFSSQAEARFNEHEHAIDWLRLYCTPGDHDAAMTALEAT